MSTFRAALRVAVAHPLYVVVYTVFVSLMGAFIALSMGTSGPGATTTYEPYPATVAIVDRDGSDVSRAFVDHMASRYKLVDVADDPAELQDGVATGRVDCVFVVPSGFGRDLVEAARGGRGLPVVEEAYGVSTQASALAGVEAQRWASLAGSAAAMHQDADQATVALLASDAAKSRARVKIHASKSDQALGAADQLGQYLRFGTYAVTSSVIVCVGMVLTAMSEPELRRRLEAGPQASRSRALATFAACAVLTLAVSAVSAAVGLVVLWGPVSTLPTWQVTLAFAANLAFATVPLAIAFLCTQLGAREQVLNAVGNVLGMVMSFMGGAWVPLSIMGSGVVAAAHLVPTFWTNDAITTVLDAAGPTSAVMGAYLTDVGVTLLFAAAFAFAGLALARTRPRA